MRAIAVFAVGLLAVLFADGQASAQGSQSNVLVSFDTRTDLVQGEPLIFSLMIQNRSDEPLDVNLGWDRKNAIYVRVNGSRIELQRPLAGGVTRTPVVRIAPNGTYSQQYVLNEWTSLDKPGSYTIDLHLDATFRTPNKQLVGVPGSATFQVNVSQRDAAGLQRRCDALSNGALSGSTEGARNAAYALSFITDSAAIGCIQKVLKATTIYDPLLIRALLGNGTEDARAVLEEMFRSNDDDRYRLASDALRRFQARKQ